MSKAKQLERLMEERKKKLAGMGFLRLESTSHWENYPYSKELNAIQGGIYPEISLIGLTNGHMRNREQSQYNRSLNEYHWLHMRYHFATLTDVRNQCAICGIRPQLTSRLKPILVGDLIIRNGMGCNFNSYHVPCAISIIKQMSDKLLQTLEKNKRLDQFLHEQEMLKNE